MYIAISTFTVIDAETKVRESKITEMWKICLWFPTVLGIWEFDTENFAAKYYKSLLAHIQDEGGKLILRESHG